MEGSDQGSQIRRLASEGHNIVFTGQCGTGKTVLMRKIIETLKGAGKRVAVTATTGMAARNYTNGTTLHHWAGLGDCRHDIDDIINTLRPSTINIIQNTDVLTIDEVGMLSASNLEAVEKICRNVRKNGKVFGGLQIVTCGDFKQLPPVPNVATRDPGRHCFMSPVFDMAFTHKFNPTQVKRQCERDLILAIRELCDGQPSSETSKLMQTLERPIQGQPTLLFGTNFEVDFVNHEMLEDLPEERKLYRAEDKGNRRALKSCQAPKILALKIGAPIVVTRNIDSQLLYNGSQGTVHALGAKPIVNFNGKLVEINTYRFDVFDAHGKMNASREQFPLKLAFALTVHRAQGITLPCVEVDCQGFFAPGQLGVAIGRSVSKNNLRVLNYTEQIAQTKHQPEVYDYYDKISIGHVVQTLTCCNCKDLQSPTDNTIHGPRTAIEVVCEPEPQQSVAISDANISQANITSRPATTDALSESNENPTIDNARRDQYVRTIQSMILELMPGNRQSNDSLTHTFKHLNSYLLSDIHKSHIRDLFASDNITKSQNKYATKLVFHIHKQIVDRHASSIVSEQRTAAENRSTEVEKLTDAAAAKIRYIGGACLSTITGRLRSKAVSNITSLRNKAFRRAAYKKHMLLNKLRASEADTVAHTTMPRSLSEINAKQGPSRGLYHIPDEVFSFFVALNNKSSQLMSIDLIGLDVENSFLICRQAIFHDQALLLMWNSLLDADEDDEILIDLHNGMCHELFCMVSEHYVRIQFVDALHRLKEYIPKTKKNALRAKLQAATSGKYSRKRTVCNSVDGEYMCPTCGNICPDDPQTQTEQSIGCDACNRWYHQSCQGVTDPTKIKVWKCNVCKTSKRRS